MSKFFGVWDSYGDVINDVGVHTQNDAGKWLYVAPEALPTEDEILVAVYDQSGYEGSAAIVYTRDGKLYEWEGSHCSCNGLNEVGHEWGGTEVSYAYLADKIKRPSYVYGGVGSPVLMALGEALELWDFDEAQDSGLAL